MILGFFFLIHFLEVLSGREGFFAKKGGVSLVRNRDLRPAAKANPTIQQAFERFQKYNRLKNLSQGSLDFYAAKGRSFFRFLGDTEQPIHTITEETVEDYIFYMKDQQLHDTTINTNLRMVRAFLYWCILYTVDGVTPARVANSLGRIPRWSQSCSKRLATGSFTVMMKFTST